jgi:hypothetical protein
MRLDMTSKFWCVVDPGPDSSVTDILMQVTMTGFIGLIEGEHLSEADHPAIYDDAVSAELDAQARYFALRLRHAVEKGATPEALRDAVRIQLRDGDGKILFDAKVG